MFARRCLKGISGSGFQKTSPLFCRNTRGFSTSGYSHVNCKFPANQVKPVPILLYLEFMKPTQFYFQYKSTLADIEKLIKEETGDQTDVEFYASDGQKDLKLEDKQALFLDVLQFENLKIKRSQRTLSYDVQKIELV